MRLKKHFHLIESNVKLKCSLYLNLNIQAFGFNPIKLNFPKIRENQVKSIVHSNSEYIELNDQE